MASTLPLFPIFSFLGFILQLVPLYWQIERWNAGTLWYIFWMSLSCITQYFNSVVWAGNINNAAPAWCEITIRVAMGASVGIPAASMCISRRLYEIMRLPPTDKVSKAQVNLTLLVNGCTALSMHQHRRAIIFDSIVCGLLPTVYILLQLAVQRHRFNILEDVGCVSDLYDSLPTYFVADSPPVLLNFGSLIFGVLALHGLVSSRASITEVFGPYNGLTYSRFLRLIGLALATSLFLSSPSVLLNIVANAALAANVSGLASPFSSGTIARIPRSVWASSSINLVAVELGRWLAPAGAFLFFAFHGFAEEAREYYKRTFGIVSNAFWNTLARMGYVRAPPPIPRTVSPARDTPSLRLQVISRPMRGVSGTGSLGSPRLHSSESESESDYISKFRTTYDPIERPAPVYVYDPFNQPVARPTTTRGGLSFVPVEPSPTEPGKYIAPPYQGWHTFSNAQLGMEDKPVVRPVRFRPTGRVVEPARKAMAGSELPPMRRIL
ncbi:Pheromone receptor Rcb2 B44 [Mycena sanguinolenta]|uniref:Pheromone receptor Rcb2 B44 n=1 Tax=Mycena sanguinolenta TaxID=230812 RepID=A0A8H7CZQ7_9AGAR|nr:Pheromone receptor Rcb2 B44 [Mycena sanguinolenta]